MLRTSLLRLARQAAIRPTPSLTRVAFRPAVLSTSRSPASVIVPSIRCYAASAGLGEKEVSDRILDLLKNFDKVTDASKLSPKSHFQNDLGLDSLDTVEVVMAIEEEFSIEIPDKDADAIHSVDQAISYILKSPDAH